MAKYFKVVLAVASFWSLFNQNFSTSFLTSFFQLIVNGNFACRSVIVWKMKSKTRIAVKKSIIKARIITGTLVLQKDRHRFNKFDISSICPMCRLEDEDIIHFLLKCPLLAGSRQEPFRLLKDEVINNSEE
jgi:hypothetical protein